MWWSRQWLMVHYLVDSRRFSFISLTCFLLVYPISSVCFVKEQTDEALWVKINQQISGNPCHVINHVIKLTRYRIIEIQIQTSFKSEFSQVQNVTKWDNQKASGRSKISQINANPLFGKFSFEKCMTMKKFWWISTPLGCINESKEFYLRIMWYR